MSYYNYTLLSLDRVLNTWIQPDLLLKLLYSMVSHACMYVCVSHPHPEAGNTHRALQMEHSQVPFHPNCSNINIVQHPPNYGTAGVGYPPPSPGFASARSLSKIILTICQSQEWSPPSTVRFNTIMSPGHNSPPRCRLICHWIRWHRLIQRQFKARVKQ
jgi:hypothetical protein